MGLLEKTKVGTKILAILLLLSAISLALVSYSAFKAKSADGQYRKLLARENAAMVDLIVANRAVSDLGYGAYMVVGQDITSAAAQTGLKMQQNAKPEAEKRLAAGAALLPDYASRFQALQAKLAEVDAASDAAIGFGKKNDKVNANASEAIADKLILSFETDMRAFRDELGKKVDDRAAELSRMANQDMMVMVGAAILAAVLGVAAGLFVSAKGITGPLNSLAGRMGRLAGGDLTVVVEGQGRGDEVGGMAKAVQVFKENGLRTKALETEAAESRARAETERARNEEAQARIAAEQVVVVECLADGLSKLSDGDLTCRLNQTFPAEYVKLQTDFNAAMDTLQEAMKTIVANTDGMLSGAGEISQAADDLSRRTEQQAASLEQTAAALDQITATVKRTAEGSNQANSVVATAKADAEKSGEVVRQAVTAMTNIDQSALEISNIIGVIDEIAFQTNLLALNAGVEAARAGEAGRGFAVVATEVRALAQRSAQAAKEIKALISTSTSQVKEGVGLVGQTGEALQKIVTQVSEITALVSEIAASAQEQSTGLAQVNTAVNQMDQMTQQNAAMVEESTAASHALAQEARELGELVGRFQIGDRTSGPKSVIKSPVHKAQARVQAFAAEPRTAPQLKTTGAGGAARKAQPDQDGWEDF